MMYNLTRVMDIKVFSIDFIYDALSKNEIPSNYAIISFSDFYDDHIDFDYFNINKDDVIKITMKDLDYIDEDIETLDMWFDEVDILKDFIIDHIKQGYNFICQCYEGKSRSAAVAWAISDYLGLGIDYSKDAKYNPNKYIHDTLLRKLKSF